MKTKTEAKSILSAVSHKSGCGCSFRCDFEKKQGDRWTVEYCPTHAAAQELLEACKELLRLHVKRNGVYLHSMSEKAGMNFHVALQKMEAAVAKAEGGN